MSSDTPRGGIATPDTRDASSPPASVAPTDRSPVSFPVPAPEQASPAEPVPAWPLPDGSPSAPPGSYPTAPYFPPAQPLRGRSGVHWGVWVSILLLGTLAVVTVAALIGGLMAAVGLNEQTAVTTKTFGVSGMPSLVVSDAAGNVTIQPGSGNQVMVQVTKHAWAGSASVAQRGLSTVAVNLTQSGDAINVRAQFTTNVFDGSMTRRSVDLLITAPAQVNVDVNLGTGNIEARQISGAMRLVSGAGNLTLSGATFAQSSLLNLGAGNITGTCAIANGADAQMRIGAGNATLTMPADTPAHLVASTGVGNMTITGWSMPMIGAGVGHHTSGDMNPHPTAMLTIQIGTGNLTMMRH